MKGFLRDMCKRKNCEKKTQDKKKEQSERKMQFFFPHSRKLEKYYGTLLWSWRVSSSFYILINLKRIESIKSNYLIHQSNDTQFKG